jgi:hypothetical protein
MGGLRVRSTGATHRGSARSSLCCTRPAAWSGSPRPMGAISSVLTGLRKHYDHVVGWGPSPISTEKVSVCAKFASAGIDSLYGGRAPATHDVQGSRRWWRGCVVLWALGLLLAAAMVVAAPSAKAATAPTTVSITFDDA